MSTGICTNKFKNRRQSLICLRGKPLKSAFLKRYVKLER